ncbi:hypothetical protein VPH35_108961 [Triticum aestivum]
MTASTRSSARTTASATSNSSDPAMASCLSSTDRGTRSWYWTPSMAIGTASPFRPISMRETSIGGAVSRAAGDGQHFQVVLVTTQVYEQGDTAIARVYSSGTGGWGALISLLLPPKHRTSVICTGFPSILVGHSLYWLLSDMKVKERSDGILEFDLERQVLSLLPVPVDAIPTKLQLMRAVGGGLGIFFLSKFSVQLWKMETDSDGVPSWVLARTVELDKLFLLSSRKKKREPLCIKGFAEYNSVVFLRTPTDLFTIQLESLKFKKVSRTNFAARYHPFESIYVAGNSICLYIVAITNQDIIYNWLIECCSHPFMLS